MSSPRAGASPARPSIPPNWAWWSRTRRPGYVGAVVASNTAGSTWKTGTADLRGFPSGPGLFARRPPGDPHRAAPRGAGCRREDGVGSVAVPGARARVARASRIYVEGRHDAELIAQVWGDDLRIEGVVVEHLGGVDDLVDIVAEFAPGPGRRLGVLVDHLVAGSKEARIADAVRRGPAAATPWWSAIPTSTSGRP